MSRTTDLHGFPLRPSDPLDRDRLASLRASVREGVQDRPGVYRMEGGDGRILYVGKSVRVRSRLLSYFRAPPGEKAAELIRETTRIDWDPIPNEFGALLAEMRLIQRHQPRFNVQHRRRRAFGFVRITREPAPRLVLTGRVTPSDGTWYGPFPQLRRVADALHELVRHLGIRDCPGPTPVHFADQLDLLAAPRDPRCIRAELRTCPAPCAAGCLSADYLRRVEAARRFLDGDADETLGGLEARMKEAAARGDFEYAALLRDRRTRLERLRDDLLAFRGHLEGLTFLYRVPGWEGDHRLYLIRRGQVLGELKPPRGAAARRRAVERVRTLLAQPDPGAQGLTPEAAAEVLLVARWFRLHPEERGRTVAVGRWMEEPSWGRGPAPTGPAPSGERGHRAVPSRSASSCSGPSPGCDRTPPFALPAPTVVPS